MSILRTGLIYAQKLLYLSGLAWLYSRLKRDQGALILMYHSVSDANDNAWIDPDNDCPSEVFDRQMNYLFQHCNVISLDELNALIDQNETIKPRTVVITFDDGYRNNYTVAADILKKYNLPATIYLATRYIDEQEPQWIDELYSYFKTAQTDILDLPELVLEKIDISDPQEKLRAYRHIAKSFIDLPYNLRRELLDKLKSKLQCNAEMPRLTLSWEEVNQMSIDYPDITFGAHTRDHVDLTNCNQPEIVEQINASIESLAQAGISAKHFSYPYGRCNNLVENIIRSTKLDSAVATEPAFQVSSHSNRYALPRLETPVDSLMFAFKLSGAYPGLSKLLFGRW